VSRGCTGEAGTGTGGSGSAEGSGSDASPVSSGRGSGASGTSTVTTEISSGTSAGRDTGGGGASVRNQSRQTWTRAEMPSPIHTLRLERCSCVTRFPQARMAPRSGATSENAQEPENAKPDSARRLAGRPAGQPQRQRLRGHGTGPAPSPRQQNADGARAPYLEASQVT